MRVSRYNARKTSLFVSSPFLSLEYSSQFNYKTNFIRKNHLSNYFNSYSQLSTRLSSISQRQWFSSTQIQQNAKSFEEAKEEIKKRYRVTTRPEEPAYCCGNNCYNCVWMDYFRDIEEYRQYKEELRKAKKKYLQQDQDQEKDKQTEEKEKEKEKEPPETQNPGMDMFMRLERQLAEKEANKNNSESNPQK